MRYTKYNYKRRKNNNIMKFIASILAVIAGATIIGICVAGIIFKILPLNDVIPEGNNIVDAITDIGSTEGGQNGTESGAVATEEKVHKFYFIQCGYFSKKDNADQALAKVQSENGAFINEEEDGKYRVFAGAYSKESVEGEVSNLASKGIESVKVTFTLDENDKVEAQVAAICDGYLQILTTTFGEDVKSVKTQEFKDWVNTLDSISEGSNLEKLQELKTYVNNLPEEITQSDVSKQMEYLYDILLSFK